VLDELWMTRNSTDVHILIYLQTLFNKPVIHICSDNFSFQSQSTFCLLTIASSVAYSSKDIEAPIWFCRVNFTRSVATQLWCGGLFSNHFITNFPQNVQVKKIWKSLNVWWRYGQKFAAYFFGPPCKNKLSCCDEFGITEGYVKARPDINSLHSNTLTSRDTQVAYDVATSHHDCAPEIMCRGSGRVINIT